MRNLSKSKLLAFRQCPKRVWLEVHRPDLRVDTQDTEARFQVGHKVGEIARRLYDPKSFGRGDQCPSGGLWPGARSQYGVA
jgi:hypothetical protein